MKSAPQEYEVLAARVYVRRISCFHGVSIFSFVNCVLIPGFNRRIRSGSKNLQYRVGRTQRHRRWPSTPFAPPECFVRKASREWYATTKLVKQGAELNLDFHDTTAVNTRRVAPRTMQQEQRAQKSQILSFTTVARLVEILFTAPLQH